MITDAPNLNILWAELIIEELIRNGVDHFIISPGSRSTPLTVAAARNPKAKTTVHFDERGAAFFALGIAKAYNEPCALICTSGTAVANYYPAIVEASMSCIPLIIITADRPPELQDSGANQTINQHHVYGEFVRKYLALPCPDLKISPEFVLSSVNEMIAFAVRPNPGPVHINCSFREPLAPIPDEEQTNKYLSSIVRWLESTETPYKCFDEELVDVQKHSLQAVFDKVSNAQRPLLLLGQVNCGQLGGVSIQRICLGNVDRWPFPIFPDVLSGERIRGEFSIGLYDLMLNSAKYREFCRPDLVLHLGGRITSKRLQDHIATVRPDTYVHINESSQKLDPGHCVTWQLRGSLQYLTDSQFEKMSIAPNGEWIATHERANSLAAAAVSEALANEQSLTELVVPQLVFDALKMDENVFLGNSMPIRYADQICTSTAADTHVLANRGASGIDGTIATACGLSRNYEDRVHAIIGDLAALHDLNSLSLLKSEGVRVTLIILNNNGGGIFHFLPIAEHTDVFEKYFGTPHGLHFEDAARMFGLPYARPATKAELIEAFQISRESGGSSIIEVVTDREENLHLHRKISDAVVKALENL